MRPYDIGGNGAQVEQNVVGAVFFHLGVNRRRHHVAGLQFVGKALPVRAEQHRAFAAHGFGDEKTPAPFFCIERGGVDLDIIDVFHFDAVL